MKPFQLISGTYRDCSPPLYMEVSKIDSYPNVRHCIEVRPTEEWHESVIAKFHANMRQLKALRDNLTMYIEANDE